MAKPWAAVEINILKDHYRLSDKAQLLKLLSCRTWNSITLKAASLNLKRFNSDATNDGFYCGSCQQFKQVSEFSRGIQGKSNKPYTCKSCKNTRTRELYRSNHTQEIKRNAAKYKKLRRDVFDAYGSQCVCCGEQEMDFLTIDHIDITRRQHRQYTGGNANGVYLYYWLKRHNYPSGFQTLCMNCNFSKYKNNGICIHQIRKRDTL